MPPTCIHGPKKFKMGRNARGWSWAGYFCQGPFRPDRFVPEYCKPTWDMELTKKGTMTFDKLPNGRLYNPKTGQYDLIDPPKPADPWAGAPAGIRVHQDPILDGATHRVLTEDGQHRLNGQNAGFQRYYTGTGGKTGLQEAVTAYRKCGWTFPDFDGAPEGFRFCARIYGKWLSRVRTENGVFGPSPGNRTWRKQVGPMLLLGETLRWYREDWEVITIDEEPRQAPTADCVARHVEPDLTGFNAERVYLNEWKAERSEPQDGDVIRDTQTGATWFLDGDPKLGGKHGGKWKQIGMTDLHRPAIIDADEFKLPERYKVLSRAVSNPRTVSRVEVIQPGLNGRGAIWREGVYQARTELQDNGRTLKVFING